MLRKNQVNLLQFAHTSYIAIHWFGQNKVWMNSVALYINKIFTQYVIDGLSNFN